MVRAELSYNPYLMETIIKFNGQSPKINSPVERYQNQKLDVWIERIPPIFCDEMNGYDFELEFSGVKSDYERLRHSFIKANVSENDVRFFF